MSSLKTNEPTRFLVAYLHLFGTSQLHLRNPFVVAAWSIAFPGLGHLLLGNYLRGFLLFTWELFINYKAGINLLILYSFIGDFEKAKQVVDIQWMALYIPTYIFAIWDSYRSTINLNNIFKLAVRENAIIKPFKMGAIEVNYLDKKIPWVATGWSILTPGTGQLYLHKIIEAAFFMLWWIVICYNANFLPAFHYTLLGDFNHAKSVLDMQWFLNIPSVYFFAMYSAYVGTVEKNKLYEREQSKYLIKKYQNSNFVLPLKKNLRGDRMYIVSTFEHSVHLELAITSIEMKGINKEKIMAIPLDKKSKQRKLFDSIHSSDGVSLFDLPCLLAVFFGIFGSIYGFVLKWGPLFWGLIAILVGFALGLIIKLSMTKKYRKTQNEMETEVVLIVECMSSQLDVVKDILWDNMAFGVSTVDI